jgi:hypothetical protein
VKNDFVAVHRIVFWSSRRMPHSLKPCTSSIVCMISFQYSFSEDGVLMCDHAFCKGLPQLSSQIITRKTSYNKNLNNNMNYCLKAVCSRYMETSLECTGVFVMQRFCEQTEIYSLSNHYTAESSLSWFTTRGKTVNTHYGKCVVFVLRKGEIRYKVVLCILRLSGLNDRTNLCL